LAFVVVAVPSERYALTLRRCLPSARDVVSSLPVVSPLN
jgi:hypothetical protein